MAKQTLSESFIPNSTWDCSVESSTSVAKFGDGYEQRVFDGLNPIKETWSVTFPVTRDDMLILRDFLKTHGSATSFYWKTPYSETKSFVCDSWSSKNNIGYFEITCKFREVFEA